MQGEIRVIENKWLVEISGKATENRFREFIAYVKKIEEAADDGFCRLVIFNEDLDFSALDYNTFWNFSKERRSHEIPSDTKSAIITFTTSQFGFARMWSSLTSDNSITVKAFTTLEEALEWLNWTIEDFDTLKSQEVAFSIPEAQ